VFFGEVTRGTPLFLTFTATGYQKAYGDVYSSPTDIFEARYATGIEALLPSSVPRTQLFAEGTLPADQLFDSTPPDPSFAPFTPATTPANLAPSSRRASARTTGDKRSSVSLICRTRKRIPMCAFPNLLDNRPAANPANGLRRAFKRNDLRTWVPTASVFLCGGANDPTVLFMNTQLIQSYWTANGVAAPVTVLDLESPITSGDPNAARKLGFAAAKAATADDWWRRSRDRVVSQHAGTAVLFVCGQIVLRQHVDLPIAHALAQRVAKLRSGRSFQRTARDAELTSEHRSRRMSQRERHVEVDATLSAVAGQRCALHFDSHVGVDFDDVRSKPRDVERVLPNHLAIVPRERFEHRADLAHVRRSNNGNFHVAPQDAHGS
jgi:hypothetical protein